MGLIEVASRESVWRGMDYYYLWFARNPEAYI